MSGEEQKNDSFQIFLDYALWMYKRRCEEMCLDHIKILYHIPNKFTKRKWHSYFSPEVKVLMMMDGDANNMEWSWKSNQNSLPSDPGSKTSMWLMANTMDPS